MNSAINKSLRLKASLSPRAQTPASNYSEAKKQVEHIPV